MILTSQVKLSFFPLIDPRAVDENTPLTYTTDDIRLCTIPSTISLSAFLYYHRHERFHYIKLSSDTQSTLISRTGIKSFDRIIEFNGVNIESNTSDTLKNKINNPGDLPFELLVCNPATYAHFKSRKNNLHHDLATVQRVKPFREPNYELVEGDGSLACFTLINSMYSAGDTFDGSQFLTAQPSLSLAPQINRPLSVAQSNQNRQVCTEIDQ